MCPARGVFLYVKRANHISVNYRIAIGSYAGRWDEVIASKFTALRLSPGSADAHYFIGTNLLFKGEPQAAAQISAAKRLNNEFP